jgi:hypothetical protein
MVAGHVSSLGPLLPLFSPDMTGISDQHIHRVLCIVRVVSWDTPLSMTGQRDGGAVLHGGLARSTKRQDS